MAVEISAADTAGASPPDKGPANRRAPMATLKPRLSMPITTPTASMDSHSRQCRGQSPATGSRALTGDGVAVFVMHGSQTDFRHPI